MPYFHVVSYAFSRSKKINTACSFLAKAFRIKVTKRTRWSNVLLPWRNPHYIVEKSPLDSRNHTRRALIIRSIRPNNLSLVCLYLSLYISYLLFWHFFLTHRDGKHYYIKVVESIQFVWAGSSGISRILCNANTYRSIHDGLFFNSSPALDLKIPLETPLYPFLFLFASVTI